MNSLNVALAQLDSGVGDFAGNVRRIAAAAQRARDAGADLLVCPELALSGAACADWLKDADFLRASDAALDALARQVRGIDVLVGHPRARAGKLDNAAALLREGRVVEFSGTRLCQRRPLADDPLERARYFTTGRGDNLFSCRGVRCAVVFNDEALLPGVPAALRDSACEVILNLAAVPYQQGQLAAQAQALQAAAATAQRPLLRVNAVGGQDEWIFAGASLALAADGEIRARLAAFEEALQIVRLDAGQLDGGAIAAQPAALAELYAALVLGVRDYVGKNGFPGVLLGLSGGIDSALVLAIAVDALGADRVRTLMMPSPHTAPISLADAREMAARLGVAYGERPIEPALQALCRSLEPEWAQLAAPAGNDTTLENLQARVRGLFLMALSNRSGALVLTTSNKSESAVGYATLYGDMAGGLAVLKDVYKTRVYALARYRNGIAPVIPERILTRAPTAELRAGQTDQDSLPPYEILDAILEAHIEGGLSGTALIARGHAEADVRRVLQLVKGAEHKRRQAAPGLRVSARDFGRAWHKPITCRSPADFLSETERLP